MTSRSITSGLAVATAGSWRFSECPGKRDAGGDHPDVTERLRKVAEELARRGIDLLGQQPDGARPSTERGVELRGLVHLSLPGQVLDQPEAAEHERALLAGDSVG